MYVNVTASETFKNNLLTYHEEDIVPVVSILGHILLLIHVQVLLVMGADPYIAKLYIHLGLLFDINIAIS